MGGKDAQFLSLYPWLANKENPFYTDGKKLNALFNNAESEILRRIDLEDCKKLYKEFEDKLKPLSVFENMENVNDPKEWEWLFNRAKNEGVKMKSTKYERKAKVKEMPLLPIPNPTVPLSMYTKEEIVVLMKNFYVYATTNYFVYLRKHDYLSKQFGTLSLFNKRLHMYKIDKNGNKEYCNEDFWKHLMYLGTEYRLARIKVEQRLEELGDNVNEIVRDKDLLFEQYHYMTVGLCYDIQNYFNNNGREQDKEYEDKGTVESNLYSIQHMPLTYDDENVEYYFNGIASGEIPNLIEELHINDAMDKELGRATMKQIYFFIYDTLQYMDEKQLMELIKLADNKYEYVEKVPNHRPIENKRIGKYDKLGNLIEIYENRKEAMIQNKVTGAIMSQLLSGKKPSYCGFKYKFVSIEA